MKTIILGVIAFAFTAPAWGGGATTIQGLIGTQLASSAYNACISGCIISAADPNFDYVSCTSDCEAKHLGSVPGETMRADTSLGVGGDTLPVPSGFDTDNRAGGGQSTLTRIASSIRLGDPQPICGTDAWACFNGTDDESPMIRDVGVFASNRPCMHPSCD